MTKGAVIFTSIHTFSWTKSNSRNLVFCMRVKDFPIRLCDEFKLVTQIQCANQQKGLWFERDFKPKRYINITMND